MNRTTNTHTDLLPTVPMIYADPLEAPKNTPTHLWRWPCYAWGHLFTSYGGSGRTNAKCCGCGSPDWKVGRKEITTESRAYWRSLGRMAREVAKMPICKRST